MSSLPVEAVSMIPYTRGPKLTSTKPYFRPSAFGNFRSITYQTQEEKADLILCMHFFSDLSDLRLRSVPVT